MNSFSQGQYNTVVTQFKKKEKEKNKAVIGISFIYFNCSFRDLKKNDKFALHKHLSHQISNILMQRNIQHNHKTKVQIMESTAYRINKINIFAESSKEQHFERMCVCTYTYIH